LQAKRPAGERRADGQVGRYSVSPAAGTFHSSDVKEEAPPAFAATTDEEEKEKEKEGDEKKEEEEEEEEEEGKAEDEDEDVDAEAEVVKADRNRCSSTCCAEKNAGSLVRALF
jgi:hypothetical protein